MITDLKQNMAFVVVALALVAGGYWFFFQGSGGGSATLTSDTVSPDAQQILTQLSNLQTISLDGSVFQDPVYLSLTDFGVVLAPEPAGRRNPFAPISFSANQTNTQLKVPGN